MSEAASPASMTTMLSSADNPLGAAPPTAAAADVSAAAAAVAMAPWGGEPSEVVAPKVLASSGGGGGCSCSCSGSRRSRRRPAAPLATS